MKVLQLGYSYEKNAQGAITRAIEKRLDEKGIENHVIFYEEGTKSTANAKQCNPLLLSLLTRLLNKLFGRKKEHSYIQTMIAIYWINKFKPDIVHLHIIHHGYYEYEALFSYLQKKRINVVFTMHDMWLMTGGCYHFTDIFCNRYKEECMNCPGRNYMDCSPKETNKNLLIKRNFVKQLNVQIVAVSEWVKRMACGGYINDGEIITITNGIDTDCFRPATSSDKDTDFIHIVCVANEWSKEKGIYSIFDLAGKLDNSFVFDLVGDCPKSLRKDAPSNILFVGRINDKYKLAQKYRESDIFLHLSKCETFGMVIAEAACCGLPVIAYRSTGIEEVVERVNGTLVEVDDHTAIINALLKFKTSRELKKNDVDSFLNDFSIETMADRYIECYKRKMDKG